MQVLSEVILVELSELNEGDSVTVLDNLNTGKIENLKSVSKKLILHKVRY